VARLSAAQLRVLSTARNARFVAILDAANPQLWQLTIVDPATNRAMVRSLVGAGADQAAIEAAISIIVSANQVLASGEPVGELSVDEALAQQPLAAEPPQPNQALRTTSQPPLPAAARTDSEPNPVAVDLSLAVLGEPLAQPGGYGIDWTMTLGTSDSTLNVYAGPSLSMGFPTTVRTTLGHSEFHRLQLGVAFGALFQLGTRADLGLTLEPLFERTQARHRATRADVVARDSAPNWTFASRAGVDSRVWLTPRLAVVTASGVMVRPYAPVYVDSRGQTLLSTTPTAWFVQLGALFRFMP
jgi:hypothetical protein